MTPDTALVLITYNSERFLPRCAEGVSAQTTKPSEIVIIDNASSDNSLSLAGELFSGARLISNSLNLGFAAAANQGIDASTAGLVLLLNPDVFMTSSYIEILAGELSRGSGFGSATGKLLRGIGQGIVPTDMVDSKGIRMTRSGRHLDIGSGERDAGGENRSCEVFGVSGAAALYKRECLEDLRVDGEIFDEDFFAYREDADLSWRGQLFGWNSLYEPGAVAYHVRSVTPQVRTSLPPSINMHSVKNRFLLRLKNQGIYLGLRDFPFQLVRDLMVLGATLTVERSSLPAWRWLWHHRKRVMKKRAIIQRRRRRSDREIAAWFGGRAMR